MSKYNLTKYLPMNSIELSLNDFYKKVIDNESNDITYFHINYDNKLIYYKKSKNYVKSTDKIFSFRILRQDLIKELNIILRKQKIEKITNEL